MNLAKKLYGGWPDSLGAALLALRSLPTARLFSRLGNAMPNLIFIQFGGALSRLATALMLLAFACVASAFNPNANGNVNAIAIQPNGQVLIAGDFSSVGGVARNRFARLNADGSVDMSVYNPGFSNPSYALALQADGGILIGGRGVGGAGGILRLNADGTRDTGFTDALSSGANVVRVIVPLGGGKILVGGEFSVVGGLSRPFLARLNADGSVDAAFDARGAVANAVYGMVVQSDGRLVIGGASGLLKRLQADGAIDTAASLAVPNAVTIQSVALQADGKILVGASASLTFGDAVERGTLVRLNAEGSVDDGFSANLTGSNSLQVGMFGPVLIQPDGKIVAAPGYGRFPRRFLADGGADPGFAGGTVECPGGGCPNITALAMQADGKIVFGGSFSTYQTINGLARGRIARLHSDGRLDNGGSGPLTVTPVAAGGAVAPAMPQLVGEGSRVSFELMADPGNVIGTVSGCGGVRTGVFYTTGFIWSDCEVIATFVDEDEQTFDPQSNGDVHAIAVQSDGRIVVGGGFNRIGGLQVARSARLESAGGAAEPGFFQYPATSSTVLATVVQDDGKVLLGGQYGAGLSRVNVDGSLDQAFEVSISGLLVQAIDIQTDGKIVIGGHFASVDGVSRNHVARLNADGSLDASFDPGSALDSYVHALVAEPDGHIVVGGVFTSPENTYGLARFNSDGSLDTTFPGAGTGILAMYRYDNGSYLLGGGGSAASSNIDLGDGSVADSRLIRMLPNRTRDLEFEAVIGDGQVHAIAVQADGKVVVGGSFSLVNGQDSAFLVRLHPNGSRDMDFDVAVDGPVYALALQADGKLLIGGTFSNVGGYARRGIARLTAGGQVDVSTFIVAPYASADGTISPNVPQIVAPGQSLQFAIKPDPGYVIGAVDGCNGNLSGLVYTTGPIMSHCSVTVSFLADIVNYTVTPVASSGGSFAPDTPQQVLFAQMTSFTVIPDEGHYLQAISGCGGTLLGDTYTTGHILGDCTVQASFGHPEQVAIVSGSGQITAVGTRFATPLVVKVTDGEGAPVPGVPVQFSSAAAGPSATLSANTATTDAAGVASVMARANAAGGAYSVAVSADGLQGTFALTNQTFVRDGIELSVTLSRLPPPACGTETDINAVAGEPINYCFTATNHSEVTLNYHTLSLATFGHQNQYSIIGSDRFFHRREIPLLPGQSTQYNRVISVGGEDQAPQFTWTASATLPAYDIDDSANVPFTDISASGTATGLGFWGRNDLWELPFPFHFYGQTFLADGLHRLCINNSGSLQLEQNSEGGRCPDPATSFGFIIPTFVDDNDQRQALAPGSLGIPGNDNRNGILPYWDLLGDRGDVYYQTVGTAPNRRFIVQWKGKDHGLSPNPAQGITFQTVFEETTGRIHFVYQYLNFDVLAAPSPDQGGSAGVGLVDYHDDTGQQHSPVTRYSWNEAVLHDGQAITLTPTDVTQYASASVMIDVGRPLLAITPGALHAHASSDGIDVETLTIGNAGDLTLEWSLDELPAQAHFPSQGVTYMAPTQEPESVPKYVTQTVRNSLDTEVQFSQFEVPAYGVNFTGSGRNYVAVSFDADNPTQFVPLGSGSLISGDFIGSDLSRLVGFDDEFDSDFSFSTLNLVSGMTNIANGFSVAPEGYDQFPSPRWAGVSWDGRTETLFASTTGGFACSVANESTLYRVNPSTGVSARIGVIETPTNDELCIADIAVSPSGAMYGIDSYGNRLVAIDKTTGEAAIVGWLGVNLAESARHSLDFDDATDTLYLAAAYNYTAYTGGMYRVDTLTGMASFAAPFPIEEQISLHQLHALGIAKVNAACSDPANVPWLTLAPAAGVTDAGATTSVQLNFDATGLSQGVYEATLCVFSNDRSQSLVHVPVSFVVGTPVPEVFADGFED